MEYIVSSFVSDYSIVKSTSWPFEGKSCLFGFEDETQYENSSQELSDSNNYQIASPLQLSIAPKESQIEIIPKLERIEEGFKRFKCQHEGCSKAYRSKENLTFHIKNIHLNLKPFQCSFCELKFSHRNGKSYHERKQHTSNLPYECRDESCKQKFPCKSAMVAHYNSLHLSNKRKPTSKGLFSVIKEEEVKGK